MTTCLADRRKTDYPGETRDHGVELVDGVWQVRGMEAVRQVLRSRETTQAGFNAELSAMGRLRRPILFADGEPHRTQRSAIARYFAPKTVDSRYHEVMETSADEQLPRCAATAPRSSPSSRCSTRWWWRAPWWA